METIEHPSLQWEKSLQAATKISTGEIALTCCCAWWLTLTRVRVVMWYQGNPTLVPKPNPSLSWPVQENVFGARVFMRAASSRYWSTSYLSYFSTTNRDVVSFIVCDACGLPYQCRHFTIPKAAVYAFPVSNNILKKTRKTQRNKKKTGGGSTWMWQQFTTKQMVLTNVWAKSFHNKGSGFP